VRWAGVRCRSGGILTDPAELSRNEVCVAREVPPMVDAGVVRGRTVSTDGG